VNLNFAIGLIQGVIDLHQESEWDFEQLEIWSTQNVAKEI
jgi:hypothetical protein